MTDRTTAAVALLASMAAGVCTLAEAQNVDAAGRYGAVNLAGAFLPDPHTVAVQAGGADRAAQIDAPCDGYISFERPDYELHFAKPSSYALKVFAVGDVDTTLVVNDPSGRWHCNDDFDARGGTNPGIVFDAPMSGTYDIWVGAYDAGDTGESVQLVITEASAPWQPAYGTASLHANFLPDPYIAEVQAGGQDAANTFASGCVGYVRAIKPDYGVIYSDAGPFELGVFASGEADATLVVKDPGGRIFCNDDYSESSGYNPGIVIPDPMDGFYSIWVGTYARADLGKRVELVITERGSPWGGAVGDGRSGGTTTGAPVSSGTGFVVSRDGHVLTNHHVVDGCARTTFEIRGNMAVEADVLAVNAGTDLALLKTSPGSEPLAFRAGNPIRLGDEVVVFGFPLRGDLSSQGNLTHGIVSALSGLNDDLSRLQMTAPIQPGNSGGPLLDRYGHVVGVVVEMANDEYFRRARGTAPQNVNFAVRDGLARSFLETHNVPHRTEDSVGEPLAIADVAESAQRATGIVLCYR